MAKSVKPKKDINQVAKSIVDIATGETPSPQTPPHPMVNLDTKKDHTKNPAAVSLGRLGGLKGGKARAAKLSPKKRSEIAKKAAAARWGVKK